MADVNVRFRPCLSVLHALCLALACVCGACAPDPSELSPSEALGAFLTAIERSTHAPDQRKVAYSWLDLKSQEVLAGRARLANSLAGRKVKPWEILVPGRVSFAGQSIAGVRMTSKIEGNKALVSILVEEGKPIEVPMLLEAGQWRVELELNQKAAP